MACVNKEGLVLAAGAECISQEAQEVKEETKTEETQEGNGITGAAVTTPSSSYSTKTKLLIAGIVVLVIIIAGYLLTKKDDNITPTEERKE